jgi:hypothetical protein
MRNAASTKSHPQALVHVVNDNYTIGYLPPLQQHHTQSDWSCYRLLRNMERPITLSRLIPNKGISSIQHLSLPSHQTFCTTMDVLKSTKSTHGRHAAQAVSATLPEPLEPLEASQRACSPVLRDRLGYFEHACVRSEEV